MYGKVHGISSTKPISQQQALVSQAQPIASQAQVKTEFKSSRSNSVLSACANGNSIAGGQGTAKVRHQIQLHNSFGVLGSPAVTCH